MDVLITAYEYFAKHAEGRKSCLSFFGRSFSGEETIRRVNAMADFLAAKGVGKGDVVAINLPNTPECVFTIYAVNKLGAIAFVTHPLLPLEALRVDLARTDARLLVCMNTLTADVGVPKVLCDGVSFLPPVKRVLAQILRRGGNAAGEKYPYEALGSAEIFGVGAADDVAFYLPSGGTTGEPKIIRVTNRAVNANAEATLSLAKTDLTPYGVLLALPFFHGFGLSSSLHGAVSGGAEGVIVPYFNPKTVAHYVARGKVNIILGVPNMYRKLLAEKTFRRGIKKMRLAFSGGDTLPERMKLEYDECAKKAGSLSRLYQGYGLAETVSVCVANSFGEDKAGAIGKPVNATVKVLKEDGSEAKTGEVGEIAVRTECMMKGYLGQEDFSAPYLLTGDLGFTDEEGFVHFSGRKKRIIVIGGMNVYPVEIERAAMSLDFVTEAAAIEYRVDNKPMIALFLSDRSELSQEKKREVVRARLSSLVIRYAMPTKILFLPEIPHTDVGKADLIALAKRV